MYVCELSPRVAVAVAVMTPVADTAKLPRTPVDAGNAGKPLAPAVMPLIAVVDPQEPSATHKSTANLNGAVA